MIGRWNWMAKKDNCGETTVPQSCHQPTHAYPSVTITVGGKQGEKTCFSSQFSLFKRGFWNILNFTGSWGGSGHTSGEGHVSLSSLKGRL